MSESATILLAHVAAAAIWGLLRFEVKGFKMAPQRFGVVVRCLLLLIFRLTWNRRILPAATVDLALALARWEQWAGVGNLSPPNLAAHGEIRLNFRCLHPRSF